MRVGGGRLGNLDPQNPKYPSQTLQVRQIFGYNMKTAFSDLSRDFLDFWTCPRMDRQGQDFSSDHHHQRIITKKLFPIRS